jgi:adenylate kinase
MNNKVLNYAKKQIEETDKSIIVLLDNHLYIQTSFGRVYKLSEDEIFSLAKDYLENEIISLEHI